MLSHQNLKGATGLIVADLIDFEGIINSAGSLQRRPPTLRVCWSRRLAN
jgi:hypothetical protein